ncbi:leucine-rich repeat-containing 74A-like isoform X2 [Brachionus plicatilis]|uniref:Leucine-rich repeat-containing 74A-like isoform X2 n=1 Tax=Brachionus plicatilis TaxID=10195 RepID=A0A3M7QW48_BRAPC|nr:leucine-rich repeat-containing 74A-like isoform X2 [Brachionus plicatilis]
MQATSKTPTKDPSIEAIQSNRASHIENIYNKNLRPIDSGVSQIQVDTSDQENTLIRENTHQSLESYNFDSESDNGSTYSTDATTEYESICHSLRIVPCSIVLKSLPTSSISLNNYGLTSTGILALTFALKNNITVSKLDLSGNEIGSSGLRHLSILLEESISITDLNISRNFVGSQGVKYLEDILKKNRYLKDVDISSNNFNDEDGVLLIESLEDSSITHLNLSQNKLGDKSGIAIGKWLADNGNLIELNLSWNHFRKKGAVSICKGIWDNNYLKKINLAWNGFGSEGAEMLGKALAHNVILEELDLRSNRIGPTAFASLAVCFKDNNSLKRLIIGKNNITTDSLEAVLKLFTTLSPFYLELLDVSNITLKPSIHDSIQSVKEIHPNFNCLHGFLNFSKKKTYNPSEAAIMYIQEYCQTNNVSLMDLFAKLDTSGIPITPAQIDALIAYLDRDGDGEIDFSELVIGEEQVRKLKENS